MNGSVSFQFSCPAQGFEWTSITSAMDLVAERSLLGKVHRGWNPLGEETPRRLLRAKTPQKGTRFGRLDDSALFRTFAAMEPTPEEIIAFANQYGSLWKECVGPFSEWEYEVRTMRFLVELWEAVNSGKRSGIVREHFRPNESGEINDPFEPKRVSDTGFVRTWESSLLRHQTYGMPRPGGQGRQLFRENARKVSPIEVARRYLLEVLNVRLESTGAVLRFDRLWAHTQLTVEPKNLIGALWAQFAVAVSANKEFRQCSTCGRSFELTPDIARTSRFYCDDACRVKAYRGRQAKAKLLNKQGKTAQQIAEVIGSDTATVKKWLSAKPRKGK